MLDVGTQLRDYFDATAPAVDLEEIANVRVDDSPVSPLRPRRAVRPIPGWVYTAAAALVVLVLVGGMAWLSRAIRDDVVEPSTTTTTLGTTTTTPPTPVDAVGLVGPGSWSVAASLNGDAISAESLADLAAEVRTWPGVLGVVEAPDESAWRQLIGDSACDHADFAHLCDAGIVVLATLPWTEETAHRLETESGLTAVSALDVPAVFWDGYKSAVADQTDPIPMEFDPSNLGTEILLERAGTGMQVGVRVEDVLVEVWIEGGPDPIIDGRGLSMTDLLIDRSGHGGAWASLAGWTSDEYPLEQRRTYVVGGLPLDSAVVTTELADGTPVWQRPIAGMALIVDKVGSLPELFRPFYDQDYERDGRDQSELQDLDLAAPLIVLDRSGQAIMRIEDRGHDSSLITDLRLDPDLTRLAGDTPVPPSRTFPEPIVSNPTVIQATDGSTTLEVGRWVRDLVVTDGAIWVQTSIGGTDVVVRIDAATLQVTDTIESGGWNLYLAAGALWSLDRNEGTVARIDLNTRQVTDTIMVGSQNGQLAEPVRIGDSLWFPVWRGSGFAWLELDLVAREIANEWQVDTEFGADWSAAIDGAIWSWTFFEGISRFDPRTGQRDVYPNGNFRQPDFSDICCIHTDDAIFLSHPEGRVVRFDLTTLEVTSTLQLEADPAGPGVIADGALWIPATRPFVNEGVVYRIDPDSLQVIDVINVGPKLWDRPVAGDGALWVYSWSEPEEVIARIDLQSRQVTHIIEGGSWAPVFLDGSVWIPREDGNLTRIELP